MTVGKSEGRARVIHSPRWGFASMRAAWTCRTRWKWVKVWRISPICCQGAGAGASPPAIPSVAGKAEHPAQKALVGAAFQKQRVGAMADPDLAMAGRFVGLWQFARQVGGYPIGAGRADGHPGADRAGGAARRADGGAKVHHRLSIVAGSLRRGQTVRPRDKFGFRGRKRGFDLEHTGHDPFDIAVNHGCGFVKGNRSDGGGGIGADAGQGQKAVAAGGELATVIGHHGTGAFQKVPGAGVIAKARPFGHHVFIPRRGQCSHIRPTGGEALEIGGDGSDGCLLQHHLGQPDAIGVGTHPLCAVSRTDAPRHHAGVPVIPVKKQGAWRVGQGKTGLGRPRQ